MSVFMMLGYFEGSPNIEHFFRHHTVQRVMPFLCSGSITKTVTALLLAMETLDGLVEIDEPVDDILQDEDIDLTDQNGVAVTLRHLTTHSSSMPRFPDNVEDSQTDPDNPYKDYSREDLFEYLRTFQPVNVGETFSYSNVAVATLGEALAIRKDRDYKEIVRNEILDVLDLGMEFEMPPDKEINFAQGYSLGPVSSWEFDALASAGALRSNIIDLLKYGVLYLDEACPLAEAMDLTKLTYFVSQDGVEHGLGWFKYEENIIEHGGATGGYLSFVGIDLVCDRVVAAMTNSGVVGVESIAKEILSGGC